jgi:hypothetical protein
MKKGKQRGIIFVDIGPEKKRHLDLLARESGMTVSLVVRLCLRSLLSGKVKISDLVGPLSAPPVLK